MKNDVNTAVKHKTKSKKIKTIAVIALGVIISITVGLLIAYYAVFTAFYAIISSFLKILFDIK